MAVGATLASYATSEATLARAVLPALRPDMVCLADRYFLGFDLWQQAAATGAALVWRAKASQVFPMEGRCADGSYRSSLRWNSHYRATDRTPMPSACSSTRCPASPTPSRRIAW